MGSAESTMYGVNDSKADEIWSLSWMYNQEMYAGVLPRIDRMFELHPLWYFNTTHNERLLKHWDWLQEEHDFPVYVQEMDPRIPSGVLYPFDEVSDDIFGGRLVTIMPDGTEEDDLFYSCTVAYQIALAIHEGFDRIETYGFEMRTDTEWRYQVAGASFMAGVAMGRGVTITRPHNSGYVKGALYAYEVTQLITRQQLEIGKQSYTQQRDEEIAKMNLANGKFQMMKSLADSGKVGRERLEQLARDVVDAEKRVERCIGAVQSVEWQLATIDLEEPEAEIEFGGFNKVGV